MERGEKSWADKGGSKNFLSSGYFHDGILFYI